ncbi:MAG: hypothetical protein ACP5VE_03395 [Chthonomonadales bacterium]
MTGMDAVSLRLHSGIPIIDVRAQMGEGAEQVVHRTISALAEAGHFEVILNVCQAGALNRSLLPILVRAAAALRGHCGHLTLVHPQASADVAQLAAQPGIRITHSEIEALARIKRMRLLSPGPICRAYLAEYGGTPCPYCR